jgi:TolB protein
MKPLVLSGLSGILVSALLDMTGIVWCASGAESAGKGLGIFATTMDIGAPKHPGKVVFDSRGQSYIVSGGGANMWFTNDAFRFVGTEVSGDFALAADIVFQGKGVDAHRKACVMVRGSLDADAAYADAVLHGDGLTSLQYRELPGGPTREIQSNVTGPHRLRLEKRGHYISMSLAGQGQPFRPAGGAFRLDLSGPFYVGFGVCAHNDTVVETAVFSNVSLTPLLPGSEQPSLISTLETVTISSKDRRVVWWTTNLIEAPNWSKDGTTLYYNSAGRIFRIPHMGGEPKVIDTGLATRNNNDHGIAPDGTHLAISDQSQGDRQSRIYIVPVGGGIPRLVTEKAPSYWHGWSPDGRTLAYCAERSGEFDVYTIPLAGGAETRLTTASGLDDGPDYSHDGVHIYFNSDRTGRMQIWRMLADGSRQEQVTNDDRNNWFPHPSPDGRWVVYVSYDPEVKGHPANKDVWLCLLSLNAGRTEVLAKLLGGQGTINVPSWSPDSRKLAFVSYQLIR